MAKKKKSGNKKKNNTRRSKTKISESSTTTHNESHDHDVHDKHNHNHQQQHQQSMNFMPEAGPGCYIVRLPNSPDDTGDVTATSTETDCTDMSPYQYPHAHAHAHARARVLGWDLDIDPEDYHGFDVPDLAIDPEENTLTVCNLSDVTKIAYVTIYTDTTGDTTGDTNDTTDTIDGGSSSSSSSSSYKVTCYGRDGMQFIPGHTFDGKGNTFQCVTFIVLSPPMTFCTLCSIGENHDDDNDNGVPLPVDSCPPKCEDHQVDITRIRIESDVQEWKRHPHPEYMHDRPLRGFPLGSKSESCSQTIPVPVLHSSHSPQTQNGDDAGTGCNSIPQLKFLCTQGVGGHLTHFFSGNMHAIDFRCDAGTPVLAVEDGVVAEVVDGNTNSGIGVSNMFQWNSVMLRHRHCNDSACRHDEADDDGSGNEKGGKNKQEEESTHPFFYTEYVHIQSANVRKGDVVRRGDRIATSGSVGFSPEPHLHFALYWSGESDAVSVGFEFLAADGVPYRPVAGRFYNASGPCAK